jgi:hypothetical protein
MPVRSQICEGDVLYIVLNFMALLPLEVQVGIVGRYFSAWPEEWGKESKK